MTIWLALAIGFFVGGVGAVLQMIYRPLREQLDMAYLLGNIARNGLLSTAVVWGVCEVWVVTVAAASR